MPRTYLPLEMRVAVLKRLLMQGCSLSESLRAARIGWDTWRRKVKPVLFGDSEFLRFQLGLTPHEPYMPLKPRPLDAEGRKRLMELIGRMFRERRGYGCS